MLTKEEIRAWLERKIDNYLKNYVRRNKLNFTQTKAIFFTKAHEKFLKTMPQAIKKLMESHS